MIFKKNTQISINHARGAIEYYLSIFLLENYNITVMQRGKEYVPQIVGNKVLDRCIRFLINDTDMLFFCIVWYLWHLAI